MRTLARHGVRFIVIGGFAGALRGSPVVTGDLDVCYSRDAENLERLAQALRELNARLRGPNAPADLPSQLDARTLSLGDSFAFVTDGGSLDVIATPSGTSGFPDLDAGADWVEIDRVRVRVARVDDLIRMKRAASRRKDREHIPWLMSLRDQHRPRDGG